MNNNINPIFSYNDYRKFTNFLDDRYELPINHINPLEYFKLDNLSENTGLDNFVNTFFKGKHVVLPEFRVSNPELISHNRFENYTGKDEVKNISLWTLAALSLLSEENPRLGKELEILQESSPRDGRLDVTVLDNNNLLVLEAKVSLRYALSEGRFRYQIPEYRSQAEKTLRDLHLPYNLNVLLIIGGEETDLFPPGNPDCTTGQVGDMAKIFYDNLEQYNIKFISANALWCYLSYSSFVNKKLYWKDLISHLYADNTYGILSAGKVCKKDTLYSVEGLRL